MPSKKPVKKTVKTKKTTKKVAVQTTELTAAELSKGRKQLLSKMLSFKKPQLAWKKKYWIGLAGVILLAVVIYLAATKLAIAWVDGRPISFFDYYSQVDAKYGKDLKEQLVSERLVEDEAQKRHISVTNPEVDAELNTIKQQSAGQGDFNQLLAAQGLTLDELKKQIKLQLLIKKMFGGNITVSSTEVDQYISANKSQFPTSDDATKAQVKQQLEQQKLVDAFKSWLTSQQSSNRVVRFY